MCKVKDGRESRKRDLFRGMGVISSILLLIALTGSFAFAAATGAPDSEKQKPDKELFQKVLRIQVPFIANQGQIPDEHVRFYAKTFGGELYITESGEMVYSFTMVEPKSPPKDKHPRRASSKEIVKTSVLKEKLVGALSPIPRGVGESKTKVNYFIGNDPNKWKTNLSTYNTVSFGEVYKGIDLSLKAYGKNVEKVFTIKPGADPAAIKLRIDGKNSLKINEKEELVVETGIGAVSFAKPLAYQEIKGKRHEVKVAYLLENSTLDTQHSSPIYGFKVGDYDGLLPLIIDPLLASTFLGGSNSDDSWALALDGSGNVYVAGNTTSTDFPSTVGGAQPSFAGTTEDVFISKLNSDLTTLFQSTYLGGTDINRVYALAIDGSGNVYVAGNTTSTDFPKTANGAQDTRGAGAGYVTYISKLTSDLTQLTQSTYLGGDGGATSLALDGLGNVYVAGWIYSNTIPNTAGGAQSSSGGAQDAFISKLNSNLTTLFQSTYLGGGGADLAWCLALDGSGNVYVTGYTDSSNFPGTSGGAQSSPGGGRDAFISKLNSNLTTLFQSTYLGGTGGDYPYTLALDGSGNVYVAGYTESSNFPGTSGGAQPSYGGNMDAFISKLSSDLTTLTRSTYLGGSGQEIPQTTQTLALDGSGNVYVTGYTFSTNFPTTPGAYDQTCGGYDAFVTKLKSDLSGPLLASTCLGGSGQDEAHALALDSSGNIYVTGTTTSSNFPTTVGAYNTTPPGGGDVFVSKLDSNLCADTDGDGVCDNVDNCRTVYNPPVASWVDIHGGIHSNSQPDSDLDGFGDACDLCPKVYNNVDGGPCGTDTGSGTASATAITTGPLITVTITLNPLPLPANPTYFVRPDCNNVVFDSSPEVAQNCRRRPPYILTVLEDPTTPGYGTPGGDWVAVTAPQQFTITCNLLEIFDEAALKGADSVVNITPMYTVFETDRGLDPAGICTGIAQGEICVDTTKYDLFRGTIVANQTSVDPQSDAIKYAKSVKIDIKPGTFPNIINLKSLGNVPVAILSTSEFDATQANLASVKMGNAPVIKQKKNTYQASNADVNGDGLLDKVVHFDTQTISLTKYSVEACVTGNTISGISFIGCDSVIIVH